jgi:uncharacterized membrane protein YdjX (TVP38/TMEM64 family)
MKIAGRKIPLSALAFPLFICAVVGGAWVGRGALYALFASSERLRATVDASGAWGPLVFIALQVFQVVVFMIPGEIAQIAGGYLFGVVNGTLLSVIGIALGSLLDFAAARLLGQRFVVALFGKDKLESFDRIRTSPRSELIFFLLFVIPGIPKDLLCFVAGLSALHPLAFLAVSMVGRLPGIVGSSVMGAAAADGRGGIFVGVALVAVVLFVAGIFGRDRIHEVLSSLARGRPGRSEDEERAPRPEEDGRPRTKDT